MSVQGRFDVIVIGSGPGGYIAAVRAAQLGLSTAIVEKDERLGGTCLNIGCIPSKVLLDSSELFATVRGGLAPHGIHAGVVSLELSELMARREDVVRRMTDGVSLLMKGYGVTVVRGRATLLSAGRVGVAPAEGPAHDMEAGAIVLATGSVAASLPFLPFDGTRVVSSTEALGFKRVPGKLLVVGGGAIGLELGSVWQRLGSQVTVIELLPQILPGWDSQVSRTLQRLLARQGMVFSLSTAVSGASTDAEGVTLRAKDASGTELTFRGDAVLVAVGRKPYADGLGLDDAGVTRDRGGRVVVDEHLRTSIPSVYAIGDLVPGPMLAHKAEEEGIAVSETIAGKPGHVDYGIIPSVVYASPEVASVGATEDSLRAEGKKYQSGSFVFRANGRALALDRQDGFVKVLADAETDRVLGVHIVGPSASDLISEAVTVMAFGGSAEDIGRTVHAHPTLSEVTREAALAAGGWSVNSPPTKGRG